MSPRLAGSSVLVLGVVLGSGCGRTADRPAARPSGPRVEAGGTRPPAVATSETEKPRAAPAAEPVVLTVRPERATIEPGDPGLQLLVAGAGAHGGRRDLTAEVDWEVEPPGVVTVGRGGYVRPASAGTATIRAIQGGSRSAGVRVTVAPAEARPWDFAEDVVPVFTRAGCNGGGCHGRADGQNGFHLSLFGYDPEGDYEGLVRGAGGRRLSAFAPDASLLIQKGTGRVPHAGGQRLAPGSDDYRILRDWVAAGAPFQRGKTHGKLEQVAVEPTDARLDEPGPQQVRVVARYADGHERDVTRLATYRIQDDTAADITPTGRARLRRRAETDLVIRYRTSVLSTRLATLINPDLKFDFAGLKPANFIDEELFRRLESLRVPPSPTASDAAFLRRASLDLTGELPTTDAIRKFLADEDPEKRAKLVDRLLSSPDFVRFWEIKLGDMLQINPDRLGTGGYYYEAWLHNQLAANTPWDQVVRRLLTALGDPLARDDGYSGGPANYARDAADAKVAAEQTAQRFLGLRLRCAQCHDHPFDVWTQDDYFGLAAIFARVDAGAAGPGPVAMMGKPVVKINPEGTVEHLRTKKPAAMRLLDGTPVTVEGAQDPRAALADWMTAPENPFFARAMANWVWAQLFGRGIVDPPDDLSRSNPPVHPELLDALGRHFAAHRYDLRDLVRTIATSRAYGLASATVPGNERDTRLFSHHLPRPLTAHQMVDALSYATEVWPRYQNRPRNTKAIEITNPAVPSALLDTFGRCPRTNGCSSVATPTLSLRQTLLLIGGDEVEKRVGDPNGYLANYLRLEPEPEDVIQNLYLRTLSRPPTPEELSHWSAELKAAPSLKEAAEDLFWSLLNSREFAFNH